MEKSISCDCPISIDLELISLSRRITLLLLQHQNLFSKIVLDGGILANSDARTLLYCRVWQTMLARSDLSPQQAEFLRSHAKFGNEKGHAMHYDVSNGKSRNGHRLRCILGLKFSLSSSRGGRECAFTIDQLYNQPSKIKQVFETDGRQAWHEG